MEKPVGESILERGDVSPKNENRIEEKIIAGFTKKTTLFLDSFSYSIIATVIFNILFLVCSLCLVISSALVVIGLWKDQRLLLVPWIFFMFADIFIEFSHLVYLVKLQRLVFEPLVSVMLTLDFFIMCLNVYCLLCIISQYQEYKSGRGFGNRRLNTDVIHYISTNDASASTTCLNTMGTYQTSVSPCLYHHTNFSTIPEESQINQSFDKDYSTSNVDENYSSQCCVTKKHPTVQEMIVETH